MAKAKQKPEPPTTPELEAMASQLDKLAEQATTLGEEVVAKRCRWAAKSARHANKQRANRLKRVGNMVAGMKEKGLSDTEIIARLTGGK